MFIVFYHQMLCLQMENLEFLMMGGEKLLKKIQLHTERHITHNVGKG